jgi:hypothetical protein
MKMKCLFKSVLRGDVVKPGQILDLTKEECRMDVVKKSFVAVESAPAAEKSSAGAPILVAGLTREQTIMKLQQSGIVVKGNLSNKSLVDLYNQTFSTISEVADKGENADKGESADKGEGGEAPADETTSEAEQEQLDLANS